jgi:hypothetical protein
LRGLLAEETADRLAMGRLRSTLRVLALTARSIVLLPVGFVVYWCTGRTPQFGHQALIWLFCLTQGRSNDLLSTVISRMRSKVLIKAPVGVLGDLRDPALGACLDKMRTDGFVVFERALAGDVCDRLVRFAETTRAQIRPMDGEIATGAAREALFDAGNPQAIRYDYSPFTLLDQADVQALLADQSILCLAQAYLGCRPLADVLGMWWHTSYGGQPDAHAAQFFHFDMDRIKWLKIFIYLTDVGPANGPHSFVRGSHRTGAIPAELLLRGYKRLTDEEVFSIYDESDCLEFTAPRGSIIVEDTRGLHKGAHVRGGPRLVLQLQFSNDFFGASYPRARISRVQAPSLQEMLARAPKIYGQYI